MKHAKKKFLIFAFLLAALSLPATSHATLSDDFHGVQTKLNDSLLDVYSGENETNLAAQISASLANLKPYVEGYGESDAGKILDTPLPAGLSSAAQIGVARARLQHVAALAMLQCQSSGNATGAQQWRALITLPQFANGVDSAMLLQNPEIARKPEVAATLAKEYLEWQTMRVRQLLDFLQQQVAIKAADKNVVEANENEILTLADFPPALVKIAGLTNNLVAPTATVAWDDSAGQKQKTDSVATWRDEVESGLPNLLTQADIGRMQRLLARCVKLVPREYSHGVTDGKLIIPLEYREATQFAEQSQTLVNQLAPVWKQEQPQTYVQYRPELTEKLSGLQNSLVNFAPQDDLENQSKQISAVLEDKFKITARRAGDSGDVIDEDSFGSPHGARRFARRRAKRPMGIRRIATHGRLHGLRHGNRGARFAARSRFGDEGGTQFSCGRRLSARHQGAARPPRADGSARSCLRTCAGIARAMHGTFEGRRLAGHHRVYGVHNRRA